MAAQHRFLVSGTDTGVGKTTIASTLASAFRQRGLRVGVMKPAETGCVPHDGELMALDALALRAAAESNAAIDLICPYRYAAPLAPAAAALADACEPPDLSRIEAAYAQLAADSDVMLVEGAGGLAVPITWRQNYADLALALDLELILVVANRLGCINATILSLAYAVQRGMHIKGYILNDITTEYSAAALTNAHSLETLLPGQCLGVMKYNDSLSAEICRRVLSAVPTIGSEH
jgi:dethiobiotin synthetase